MREDELTTLAKGDGSAVRAPTMRDVAALAGVSLKTVSRVVNREPGVSPELASRVLDAVALLGYRHNLTASSLRRADQKTATIGLLLEDISNPFSSELHRAIEDVASARGNDLLAGRIPVGWYPEPCLPDRRGAREWALPDATVELALGKCYA